MFPVAAIIFILFTLCYGFFSAAVIYHLRQYTLPGYPLPRIMITSFLFLSFLFWSFALYFLFRIPS